MDFLSAIKKLREQEKRNFNQTLDLIVNLKDFDIKKNSINTSVILKGSKKKICGFLETKSDAVDKTITKTEIDDLDADKIRKIALQYDFFIANAKFMPAIATKFGKILGPMGKMPDPKLGGVLINETPASISNAVSKLSGTVKIKSKETSIKIAIGKENMPDKELVQNADIVHKAIVQAAPKKELNIKSVLLKFTMSKPVKLDLKKKKQKVK